MNKERKAFELTDEDMAQVSGGGLTPMGGGSSEGAPDCYEYYPMTLSILNGTKIKCMSCSWNTNCKHNPK